MIQAVARELTAPHYSTFARDREARIVPGSCLLGGRLEIAEELARGGMSVVYRAIDHHRGGLHVALKIVTADADRPETAARYENEARLGASLAGHPHVVSPLDVGRLDGPQGFMGRMYLLTELVDGVSLDLLMAEHHTGLDWRRACTLARDVAGALVDLHARGIVHRDIKPGNVLVTNDGTETAKLIDFGLAYATGDGWEERSPDLTQDGHAPGTILYMSPQQAAHERPEPPMDIYSLGVMLYELFAGSPPYDKLRVGELLARKCDPKRAPFPIAKMCPELDRRLTELVDRCILFEPRERPKAMDVVRVLERVLGAIALAPVAVAAVPDSCPGRSTHSRRGWRRRVVGTAILLMGATGVVGLLSWSRQDPASGSLSVTDDISEPLEVPPMASANHATYATVDPDPDPELGSSEAEMLGDEPLYPSQALAKPSSAPVAIERKPSARSKRPPEPQVVPEVVIDHCPAAVREAAVAAGKRRWGQVLRVTKNEECWKQGLASMRAKLRTEAFFATGRHSECANAGLGSTDPDVGRWAQICKAKSEGSTP